MPESTEATVVLAGCKGRETRFQPCTRDIVLVDCAPAMEHERSSMIAAAEITLRNLHGSSSFWSARSSFRALQ